MPKKSASKKKTTTGAKKPISRSMAKQSTSPNIGSFKGGVVVQGDITAKRDVIVGNQYNYQAQLTQINSPQEFVAELQKLQAQITALKQTPTLSPAQSQRIEVVEGQVKDVIEEAHKPQPLGDRINATLTSAKATMDYVGEGLKSAVGLGAVIAALGQIALKLFGG